MVQRRDTRRNLRIVVALVMLALAAAGGALAGREDPVVGELRTAYAALDEGDHATAAEHYRVAWEQATGVERRFQAAVGLAAASDGLGEIGEACRWYGVALGLRPEDDGIRRQRIAACVAAGSPGEALAELEHLAASDPEDDATMRSLMVVAAAAGEHERSAAAARALLDGVPDDVEARVGLGVALFHLERYDAAVAEFERVLTLEPDHDRARFGLATAALGQGRRPVALEQYAVLKDRDPDLAAELYARLFPEAP